MAWITDAVLKKAIASSMGQGGSPDLAPHWDAIVSWANRMAYQTVRAILIGKGLTSAQADDWDANEEWNERFGVCMAIKRAAMRGEQVNVQAAIDDCKEAREELLELPILIDGVLVTTGRVTYGDHETSSDRFQLDEPDGSADWHTGEGTVL
jgi:hypothetical protein